MRRPGKKRPAVEEAAAFFRTAPDHPVFRQAVFVIYLVLAVRLLIFKYPLDVLAETAALWQRETVLEGLRTANFTLFKTIRMYIRYSDRLNSFENLAGNVAAFVPFGILLPWVDRKFGGFFRLLCNAFLFTAGIELFQLLSGFGAFDVDDILLNCVGAMTGWAVWRLAASCLPAAHAGTVSGKRMMQGQTVPGKQAVPDGTGPKQNKTG